LADCPKPTSFDVDQKCQQPRRDVMEVCSGLEAIFDRRFVRFRHTEAKGSKHGGDERRARQSSGL
jgi:hypothetical protein